MGEVPLKGVCCDLGVARSLTRPEMQSDGEMQSDVIPKRARPGLAGLRPHNLGVARSLARRDPRALGSAEEATHERSLPCYGPQKALRGGIPRSFLEP